MWCARYKYKTLLDKGEWEAQNAQKEQIISLWAYLNTLKSQSRSGSHTNRNSKDNRKERSCNRSRPSTEKLSHTKQNNNWMTVAPTTGQPKSKSKWNKTYHWCSVTIVIPSMAGCDCWVVRKSKECNGIYKRKDKDAKSGKSKSHTSKNYACALQVKSATISIKRARIISNMNNMINSFSSDELDVTVPVTELYKSDSQST